jgi:glycosyltransferase 2 family protein
MKPVTKRNLQLVAASVILVGSSVWMMRAGHLPVAPPMELLSSVRLVPFCLFIAGMGGHMLLRFARCYFLIIPIAPISLRRVINLNAVALAMLTLLPLRVGEFARPALFRERGHLSAWAITGTVGAERVLDGLLFSALLIGGLALAEPQDPLPDHIGSLAVPAALIPRAGLLAGAVFLAAFAVMAGFYVFREKARHLTERILGGFSPSLARKVAERVSALSDGLRFFQDLRYAVPFIVLSVLSTASEIWGVQMLAVAVGLPEITLSQSAVLIGVLALGFVLPNAPGFFGTVQLALYGGLAVYVAPDAIAREGAVFVFVFYASYLAIVLLQAAVALVLEWAFPSPASAAGPGREPAATH